MALPPGITPKTVTVGIASFFDGSLAEGTATITAPVNVVHTPTNRPIFSSQMSHRFVDGETTFNLAPTDALGLNRVDWTYKLNVVISGALVQPEPVYFTLPSAGPDTIDLDSLVTVPSSAGTPIVATVVTSVNGQTGDVTVAAGGGTPADGSITPAKLSFDPATQTELNTAKLKGSPAIQSMANTPAYAAPVMSSPPTITQNAAAGGTLTKNVSYTSNVFRWAGAVNTASGAATPRHYTRLDNVQASSVPASQVSFDFDGDQFDFVIKAQPTLKFRVWVNERAHAATVQSMPSGTGAAAYLNINFGSTSLGNPRRIVVELEDATNLIQFYGLRTTPTASVLPPTTVSPRVIIVGDSYGLGIGATNYSESYTKTLGRLMGWADTWGAFTSVPSTGLVKDGSATAGKYISRLAGDVIPYAPDLVIIQGSLNDNPYVGQNLIGPALTTYVQTLQAALANCVIVATSPLYVANPPANYTGVRDEMATAATTLGIPFLDIFSPVQYFTGTGKVGTTTADGNADVYRNSDGTHPTKEGHHLLARILASQLSSAIGLPLGSGSSSPIPTTTDADLYTFGA